MRAENENWGDTVRNHLFDQRSAVMVHWLILLNVVIFILGFFFQVDIPRNIYPPVHLDLIQLYGAYSEYTCFHEGELWRLLTYQFLHANLGHIMFNMIALWFFGPAQAAEALSVFPSAAGEASSGVSPAVAGGCWPSAEGWVCSFFSCCLTWFSNSCSVMAWGVG